MTSGFGDRGCGMDRRLWEDVKSDCQFSIEIRGYGNAAYLDGTKCVVLRDDRSGNSWNPVGKSQYSFNIQNDVVEKDVHWFLMSANSYHSRPQREEYFVDSGYYKFHEAYHLLKFSNERQILEMAYNEYLDLRKSNLWGNRKYF